MRNEREGYPYRLSFSVGLATFDPARPPDIEELLAAADAAMYGIKQRGGGFGFAADTGPVRMTPPTRPAPLDSSETGRAQPRETAR